MKFQKFVKSLGSDGIIYVRKNEERWLASGMVYVKIPDKIKSITASDILPMPEAVEQIINYDCFTDPCMLHRAIMPEADGAIKDCIRVFATENSQNTVAISNPDYTLLERKDIVEMYVKVDAETESSEGKALVIKESVSALEDPVTVGIIFPTEYED